ncbi:unnamed protein product [Didymodactylos carnosus]|uniref:Uncharacterized protein n=1 Tax=Didymodactylos carnosus TaxID=1234261 RepID=A0A813P181_9BILA|nr:unnamed protein product [Didymodactylos carnosus]CAF0889573.1 unnamed protein product [Didymodactylos carnosus]CAF3524898.1 unnamed protein product [Didymodactylos carnosus]CAF3672030.1 unnamed protein product [Didymodactylos carnosus]
MVQYWHMADEIDNEYDQYQSKLRNKNENKNDVLCALHQARILRERWRYWNGKVPSNVSVRLHRLESLLITSTEAKKNVNLQRSQTFIVPLSNAPDPNSNEIRKITRNSEPPSKRHFLETASSQTMPLTTENDCHEQIVGETNHNYVSTSVFDALKSRNKQQYQPCEEKQLNITSLLDSSEPFLSDSTSTHDITLLSGKSDQQHYQQQQQYQSLPQSQTSLDKYFLSKIKPTQNIVLQGPQLDIHSSNYKRSPNKSKHVWSWCNCCTAKMS